MRRESDAAWIIVVAMVSCAACQLAHADVRGDYKSPTFTIPYAATPPTIDGTIRDDQWRNALSINALQTTDGNVSTRQTTFWLMWDADHLYVAMRSPLRQGERVLQANRQLGRDNSKTVFDDSYEIWLNANTISPNGEDVFFQYLGNAAGSKYDVMFEPTVGNSRPGWESGWKPVDRITPDGKFWEMEVAIPRQSIYRDQPFTDGTQVQGLLVRNFKRPWEQNSVGGSGSFSAPDTHCKFILSKTAPAIHLLGVCDPQSKSFGVDLSVDSATDEHLKWSFASDGGVSQSGGFNFTAGHGAGFSDLHCDRPGDGYYRIQVTSEDGATKYLDWCSRRAFGDFAALTQPVHDTGDQTNLTLTFNPVKNYVRVDGDFINYDNRAAISRYVAQVLDANGNVLATKELQLDALAYVRGLMQLGDCPAGSYTARLTCYGADGKEILHQDSGFEKKDPAKAFPWWNTTAGNIEKVIAPWTPMTHQGDQIGVWGRTMHVGPAGLLSQISTQGGDILAAPMYLDCGRTEPNIRGSTTTESDTDHRVVLDSTCSFGDIHIASRVTAEFDGMYKIQLTLSAPQPTNTRSIRLIVPLKPEFAQFFHACGEGIRYGFSYGFLPPDKTGRLWDSKEVDGQPMLVGSFIPYVWIGNDHGGLCWFADSDEGWTPNDSVPAIEIRRDSSGSVDLVLNLISKPVNLIEPRTITFAFEASPVKPMRPGWRMDTWFTGDSFQDWCFLKPRGGDLIWNALPFTLDPAACKKMVEERHKQTSDYIFGVKKYHANAVPYFENNQIDKNFAPASGYFGDQWHASVSDSLAYDKTLSDFIVWNLGQWIKEANIDGWYVDNVRPVACDNIDAGRGYRLPDGRVQPVYEMFATRDFFLRVRAVFAENGKSGKFVLHMTNHMILPWLGASDLALDGEDHVTFASMNKDFMDFWSLDRMRLDFPGASGVAPTFLKEYQGAWQHADLLRVMRAYTGMCILNDILPGGNPDGLNQPVWRGRDRFGIQESDVTFVPYWNKDSGLSVDGQSMFTSAWRKPGSMLIAVVNRGEAGAATVHIDLSKFDLGDAAGITVQDADTGEPLPIIAADGTIQIPVNRHDYRQILLRRG